MGGRWRAELATHTFHHDLPNCDSEAALVLVALGWRASGCVAVVLPPLGPHGPGGSMTVVVAGACPTLSNHWWRGRAGERPPRQAGPCPRQVTRCARPVPAPLVHRVTSCTSHLVRTEAPLIYYPCVILMVIMTR
ncbi:hypothetical protein E2C01_031916 [Portunus trituberculatus]|uniref:Uncharacterized protein n=1 Tax=Portunus trituberculatus TaxID=210409 RepID=A0A5B7EU23_PORTR|nr:hypothetical protein [Portunus trituberculatus]